MLFRSTLPKKIRDHLHLAAGDRLDFVIDEDGRVVVRPGRSRLKDLRGMLRSPGRRPVRVDEMDAAIAREHSKR